MGLKNVLKREVREEWVGEHPSVKSWLSRIGEGSRPRYLGHAYDFFMWLQMNGGEFSEKSPEELLDLQDKTVGRERYKQLDFLQKWVQSREARFKTKQVMYSALKSFYEHNRVPLPRDRRFRITSNKPAVEGKLVLEDLKKIILSSNRLYQTVFLFLFQGGMGVGEFEFLNTPQCWSEQIEPQLTRTCTRLKIELPGRKRRRNRQGYYTFVGKDAVDALKRYLKQRGPVNQGETPFVNEKGKPVSKEDIRKYFHRHAREVGVIKQVTPSCPKCHGETRRVRRRLNGSHKVIYVCNRCNQETPASEIQMKWSEVRYGVNPHELRDLFRSEWELSPSKGVAAEFFLGHNIDPNEYNKITKLHPEWAEQQYEDAVPWLNIMSENPRVIKKQDIRTLRKELISTTAENEELRNRLSAVEVTLNKIQNHLESLSKLE